MRPHKLPVINEIPINNTPTSADAPAMRSQVSERVRFHKYAADETAVATAKHVIADLSAGKFAETLLQLAKCDVYGVQIAGAGWYLKLTIDPQPPEGLIVISLHPLERPLKTNTGTVKP